MRHATLTALIASVSLVAACGAYSAAEVDVSPPPAVLMAPAPPLQSDPGRALTQAEVEIMWGRDREAGRTAMRRHAGLVAWVRETLAVLGGE